MARRIRLVLLGVLVPVLSLGALALARSIVAERPMWLFGTVLGLFFSAIAGWIVVSTLWPSRADRRCPACGKDALERTDPQATSGIACRNCGYRDEAASSWFLAEEEGPLEAVVLRERRSRRARRSNVDRPRRGD